MVGIWDLYLQALYSKLIQVIFIFLQIRFAHSLLFIILSEHFGFELSFERFDTGSFIVDPSFTVFGRVPLDQGFFFVRYVESRQAENVGTLVSIRLRVTLTISFFLYRENVSTLVLFEEHRLYCISNTSQAMSVTGLTRSFSRLEVLRACRNLSLSLIFSFTICHRVDNFDVVPTDFPNISDTFSPDLSHLPENFAIVFLL